MKRWAAWGATGTLALAAACAPVPASRLAIVSPPAPAGTTASLVLRLEGPRRGLFELGTFERVTVGVDGPGQLVPYQQTVALSAADPRVTLQNVPAGRAKVVSLQAIDDAGKPRAGALAYTFGDLQAGDNTLQLSPAMTAVGAVARQVLQADRAAGSHVLESLEGPAVATALAGYVRGLGLASFRLLDDGAIAHALVQAGAPAALPSPQAAFARKAGRVVVHLPDLPGAVAVRVSLDDPLSLPVLGGGRSTVVLEPVLAGTWQLTVSPIGSDLAPRTAPVTVGAGEGADVTLPFATSHAAPPMANPLAPGVVVEAGTAPGALYVYGGASLADTGDLAGVSRLLAYSPTGGWSPGVSLPAAFFGHAGALVAGRLYAFDGSGGFVVEPTGTVTPAPLPSLPAGLSLVGTSAGALSGTIYLAGGEAPTARSSPNGQLLAFDPASNAWGARPLPALAPARSHMASVVLNDRWYLFGGSRYASVSHNGTTTQADVPQGAVSILAAGPTPQWRSGAPMPTPRFGAGAVAFDGKIWVVGGVEFLGVPSRAVEVYDPARDAWRVMPPLRTARSFPIVTVVDGRVQVSGGALGGSLTEDTPLADVEVLAP